jgi:metal-responsive CopG/Arc/MetJ family transcriptional regulator
MAIVKTAISIQESLFERADALAQQLHLSRSQLFARALGEFLDRHENRMLLEAINRSLEEGEEPGERDHLRRMRSVQRRRVQGQW